MINLHKYAIFILFAVVACNEHPKEIPVSISDTDREIERIRLKDLNDQPINLEKYRGKTIFINFWATWCKPCIEEIPSIEIAQNILQHEEVVFLLASGESAEQIENFSVTHSYKLNYVRIENSEEIGIQVLPTTFIFNPEGELIFSEMGYRKWDEKNNIDLIRKI